MTEHIRRCPDCSRGFEKKDHYDRHIRSHTKEKPFGCKICGKFYPRRDTLLRHLKTHRVRRDTENRLASRDEAGRDSHDPVVTTPLDQEPEQGRSFLNPASTLPSNIDLREADPDLSVAHDDEQMSTSDLSGQTHQHGRITRSSKASKDSTQQPVTGISFQSSALRPEPSVTTDSLADPEFLQQHPITDLSDLLMDDGPFTDSFLDFDSTNWLLDGNVVDVNADGFVWHGLQNPESSIGGEFQPLSARKQGRRLPSVLDLRGRWYIQTRINVDEADNHGLNSTCKHTNAATGVDIDEIYRTNMVEELRVPLRTDPLPPIELLNLCIHVFFTRFNVGFPVIHGPTFRPTENNVYLVLTMCAVGAMTMTSGTATRLGSMLFERVIKAGNAASWERGLSERPQLTWDSLKASVIGQTFAMLSNDSAHLAVAEGYYGCLVSLGRHIRLFDETSDLVLPDVVSPEECEKLWKRWVRYEEMKRAVVALHIHDAELAALFHHEPFFRHSSKRLPVLSPTDLFQASSAASWERKYRVHMRQSKSRFDPLSTGANLFLHSDSQVTRLEMRQDPREDGSNECILSSWAILSGISATMSEFRSLGMHPCQYVPEVEAKLEIWHRSSANCCRIQDCRTLQRPRLPFCLRPLWHHTFMSLSADLDLLELAVGRDGPNVDSSALSRICGWVSSLESKRCLLHGICLQHLVASNRVDSLLPIYTSRIIFAAAVCWHSYLLYLPWCSTSGDADVRPTPDDVADYLDGLPEVQLLRYGKASTKETSAFIDSAILELKRILRANPADAKASTLCVLESALRRLGTSGISQKLADLVQAFITGGIQ